jgi:transcriptional regulator with XRE-family HTH domain
MASIIKRPGKNGTYSYRIVVSCGYDQNGTKKTETTTFKPDPSMSERQARKAAEKYAHDFEQQIEQGFVVADKQSFSEFAEYVMKLKKRQGLKHSTEERYQALLSRINLAIGHVKLKEIRPHHLNSFYENLAEQGIRMDSGRAFPITELNPILKERSLQKYKLAELSGVSPSTISAVCSGKSISIASATSIAGALGLKAEDIFCMEQNQASLSEKTILEHHRLISTILAQAEKEMIVPYNAASKSTPPKAKKNCEPLSARAGYLHPQQVGKRTS